MLHKNNNNPTVIGVIEESACGYQKLVYNSSSKGKFMTVTSNFGATTVRSAVAPVL